jgi:ketosteroid isomerase-like protein
MVRGRANGLACSGGESVLLTTLSDEFCGMLVELGTIKINKRVSSMRKIFSFIVIVLFSFSAMAEHHNSMKAEVSEAAEAFYTTYATNDLEAYYAFYTDDALLFYDDARQNVSDYKEGWTASVEAGVRAEKYEISDMHIQLMPSGDVAVVTGFVDDWTLSANGQMDKTRAFETDIWQKIDGEWKVVGVHYSAIAPDD